MKTKFHAARQPYLGVIALHVAKFHDNGDMDIASSITFDRVTPDSVAENRPPLLSLSPDEAQALMDELWTAGIRPTEGAGSAGAMAATERHLADMKAIAFHALNISKP